MKMMDKQWATIWWGNLCWVKTPGLRQNVVDKKSPRIDVLWWPLNPEEQPSNWVENSTIIGHKNQSILMTLTSKKIVTMRWEHFRSCVNDSLLLKTIQTILRTEPATWINPTTLHIQSSNGLKDITIRPTLWPGTFTPQLPIQLSVCGEQQNTRQNRSPPPQDSQQLLLMCQMRFSRPSVSLRLEAALTSADAFRFEAKVSSGRFKHVLSHVKPYGILTQWNPLLQFRLWVYLSPATVEQYVNAVVLATKFQQMVGGPLCLQQLEAVPKGYVILSQKKD